MEEGRKKIFLLLVLFIGFTGKILETQSLVFYHRSAFRYEQLEYSSFIQGDINLVYNDSNVAIYIGSSFSTNLNWTFKPISEAWSYAKQTYEIILPDKNSLTYFIFRSDENFDGCLINENIEYEFAVDCRVSEHLYHDFTNEPSSFWLHYFIPSLGTLLDAALCKTANWRWNAWERNWMENIFAYDIFLGTGRTEGAKSVSGNKSSNTFDISDVHIRLFRDWYVPIYKEFGGANVLNKYCRNVDKYQSREKNRFDGERDVGDFLHFWSGAAGECLEDLAKKVIPWNSEYDDLWSTSRNQYPYFNYSCTNYSDKKPDKNWKEHWGRHNQNVELVFNDKNVAIYFDTQVNKSITWPFQLLSRGWEYCKNTFGPLDPNIFLHIILHGGNSSCMYSHAGPGQDISYENKNVIDCGPGDKVWDFESQENVDLLIKQLARMLISTLGNINGRGPGFLMAEFSMVGIIAYDVHVHLGIKEYANGWLEIMKRGPKDYMNIFWFKDWYYPIYTRYGTKAFQKYITVINRIQDCELFNEIDDKFGAMVHFWSIAVGENLWKLALNVLSWNLGHHTNFLDARLACPHLNYSNYFNATYVDIPPKRLPHSSKYHSTSATLMFVDANVAIYYDDKIDSSITWLFKPGADICKYVKKIYGPFKNDPIFYLVVHYNSIATPTITLSFDSFVNNEDRYSSPIDVHHIENGLTQLIQEVGAAIAAKKSRLPHFYYRMEMRRILDFDIMMGTGLSADAVNYVKKHNIYENLFFKWHYPIYARYGRSKVLNSYLNLVALYEPYEDLQAYYQYIRKREDNMGIFVHFWSGAVKENLKKLAVEAFGWSPEDEANLNKTVKDYPMIQYEEPDLQEMNNSTKSIVENISGQLLFLVHSEPNLVVYFDAKINFTAQWPFKLISSVWFIATETYQVVKIFANKRLYVALHVNGSNDCEPQNYWEDLGSDKTVIHCSKTKKSEWEKESPKNKDSLIKAIAVTIEEMVGEKAKEGFENNLPFADMISFDIYMQLGHLEDAYRLLNNSIGKYEVTTGGGKYWIWDWYLPIYTYYGGVSAFNNYLYLLAINWSQFNWAKMKKLNLGETVHFWSSAVNSSLFTLAGNTCGWNELRTLEFDEARKKFEHLNYQCYACHLESEELNGNFPVLELSLTIAGIAFAAVVILMVVNRSKMQRIRKQLRELSEDEIKEFFDGDKSASEADGNLSIESAPFNPEYEIPRGQLVFSSEDILSKGAFGLVIRGTLKRDEFASEIVVAIKTVKPNVDVMNFKALLAELKVFGFLGLHPNIVSLMGACTTKIKNRELYVALEFCAKGDLCRLMINNRKDFRDLFQSKRQAKTRELVTQSVSMTGESETTFTVSPCKENVSEEGSGSVSTLDLLLWSIQAAQGMEFIASKKVIHGDLAARNIFITADNVAKIGDFGLSRQLVKYATYMKMTETRLPWRWMAIESLCDRKFSVESDVWAFGVTLYEIFSLATTPFAGYNCWNQEFIDQLVAGQRLSKPTFGNSDIFLLMTQCMMTEPSERITFQEIVGCLNEIKNKLVSLKTVHAKSHYLCFE